MSRHRTTSAAFLGLTSLVVVASAAALATSWPVARAAAQAQASSLIGEAATANLAEASADYRLATWLDPGNQTGQLGLARTQIATGQPEAALTTLNAAGEGSEAATLRIRTLIELGRTSEAADLAAPLASSGRGDADLQLASLAFALANRGADVTALIPLVVSPEAAGHISRAQAGNLPLAAELYASGLRESSRALLVKQPASYERNLLLSQIYADRHQPADLAAARDYLQRATAMNPSGLEAHQLLAKVYAQLGQPSHAAIEARIVKQLQAGRP